MPHCNYAEGGAIAPGRLQAEIVDDRVYAMQW